MRFFVRNRFNWNEMLEDFNQMTEAFYISPLPFQIIQKRALAKDCFSQSTKTWIHLRLPSQILSTKMTYCMNSTCNMFCVLKLSPHTSTMWITSTYSFYAWKIWSCKIGLLDSIGRPKQKLCLLCLCLISICLFNLRFVLVGRPKPCVFFWFSNIRYLCFYHMSIICLCCLIGFSQPTKTLFVIWCHASLTSHLTAIFTVGFSLEFRALDRNPLFVLVSLLKH